MASIALASCDDSPQKPSTIVTSISNKAQSVNTISCRIVSDQTVYKVGQVPKINVELLNQTDSSIYLVNSLEGSCDKSRFPHSYFKIEKLGDGKYRTRIHGKCGNMGDLQVENFSKIKHGGVFNPYLPLDNSSPDYKINDRDNFVGKGKYKITYYYSTNELDFKKWLGDDNWGYIDQSTGDVKAILSDDGRELIDLFKKVPKFDIESNTLTIEIK